MDLNFDLRGGRGGPHSKDADVTEDRKVCRERSDEPGECAVVRLRRLGATVVEVDEGLSEDFVC